ncbi:hypothetical protein EIN_108600 [Entamoeba invadens IP1]|uniref:Hexosyltransferase n=1 Tax=Entamoeba invadens IP1 TaxID=370355 RepID=L7FNQ6_ENTIV|nr:hypothetical protein EIN_108600 [Entamoeba invadens IP1]ELP94698.1 hypothetical protein EIN_108600 [Entamoeba invadens IP1]|eukprot:XP_004261469.1 hypothetical protein EIN_108600 [Entamoeba invadens IP1]
MHPHQVSLTFKQDKNDIPIENNTNPNQTEEETEFLPKGTPLPVIPQNTPLFKNTIPFYKEMEKHVLEEYGPQFSLDESYPLEVKTTTYGKVNKRYKQPVHKHNTSYPQHLMLAMIHATPNQVQNIIDMRKTWCQKKYASVFGFKCIFILVRQTVQKSHKVDYFKTMNQTTKDIYFIDMPFLEEKWTTLQQKDISSFIYLYPIFDNYKYYVRFDNHVVVNIEMLCDVLNELPSEATVVGRLMEHRPIADTKQRYFDKMAQVLKKYYMFVPGHVAAFTNDLAKFFGKWSLYYQLTPTSLEDTTFGFLIYRFAMEKHMMINFVQPEKWGNGHSGQYGNFIIFHRAHNQINITEYFNRCVQDGHFVN